MNFWFSTDNTNRVFVIAPTAATVQNFIDDGTTPRIDGVFAFVHETRAGTSGFVDADNENAAIDAVMALTGFPSPRPIQRDPAEIVTENFALSGWGYRTSY